MRIHRVANLIHLMVKKDKILNRFFSFSFYTCVICSDYPPPPFLIAHPPFHSPFLAPPPSISTSLRAPFIDLCLCVLFSDPWILIGAMQLWVQNCPLEPGGLCHGYSTKHNDCSSPEPTSSKKFSREGRAPSMTDEWQAQSCTSLVVTTSAAVGHDCSGCAMPRRWQFATLLPFFWFLTEIF